MIFVGLFSLFGYVFVPRIPFFYLVILILCIIQINIFFKASQNKTFQILYFVNILSSILLVFSSKFLAGTVFFMLDSILVVLISGRRFCKSPITPLCILASWIIHFISVAVQIDEYIKMLLLASITSILLTCVYIFLPYPPILLLQGDGEVGDKIFLGHMIGYEITENEYIEVKDTIDLGVVRAAKFEEIYLKKPTTKEIAARNAIEQEVARTTITDLLNGASKQDVSNIYVMFSEAAKVSGVNEDDIKKLIEILKDERYQSADLSTLLIKDKYHYENGQIIRRFTYEFHAKKETFGVVVEGSQEMTADSQSSNEGIISKIVIYPLSSTELRHLNISDYGIYILTADELV